MEQYWQQLLLKQGLVVVDISWHKWPIGPACYCGESEKFYLWLAFEDLASNPRWVFFFLWLLNSVAPACSFEDYFPRIEAIVLFGEPVRWETPLQLVIDVLLTDGKPSKPPRFIPDSHIPVLVRLPEAVMVSPFLCSTLMQVTECVL